MANHYSDPDRLATRLDQVLPPNSTFVPPVTPDPLVNTATRIARLPRLFLSRQAVSRLEAMTLEAFDRLYPPSRKRRVIPFARYSSQIALAASVALFILIFGLGPAMAGSIPGEPLYPVKRSLESLELTLAQSPTQRTEVLLNQANRRADEALALLDRGKFDPTLVESAVSDIRQANPGVLTESMRLRAAAGRTTFALTSALDSAQQAQLGSPVVLQQLQAEVEALVPIGEGIIPEELVPTEGGADQSSSTPAGLGLIEATPTPTPTLDMSQTATPTPTPSESPTPSETPTPSMTETPSPTNTRRPTNTPRATNTPRPTNTPHPTNTPRPTNTHRPTDNPAGGQPATPPGQSGSNPGGGNPNPGGGNPNPGGGNPHG